MFYTLVHAPLRDEVSAYIDAHDNIYGVDLLICGHRRHIRAERPRAEGRPGGAARGRHQLLPQGRGAAELTIEHDDGRNPQDLHKADIVILGVSRTSKTPLCIYLAQQGYHVANVPLDLHTAPPKELFDVDRSRIFGLMSTPDVLVGIRERRLGAAGKVAGSYADPEYVYDDLDAARRLMRQLGCYVIRTDNRAVEETAQEILSLYLKTHAQPEDESI